MQIGRIVCAFVIAGFLCDQPAWADGNVTPVPPRETTVALQDIKKLGNENYTEFLVGIVAAGLKDSQVAGDAFRAALKADPTNKNILQQAFFYSVVTGNPMAVDLAKLLPSGMLPNMVLGNDAARKKNWGKARDYYNAIPTNALTRLLKPLLVGWTYQGQGNYKTALATLMPAIESNMLPVVYTLHAALIADTAGYDEQAARYYYHAIGESTQPTLQLVVFYGNWLVRNKRKAEAQRLVEDLMVAMPGLAVSREALEESINRKMEFTATDGIAQSYLVLASLVQEQITLEKMKSKDKQKRDRSSLEVDAEQTEEFMLRFALDMDPTLGSARLMMSSLFYDRDLPASALGILEKTSKKDVLDPVIELRRGRLYMVLGEFGKAQALLEGLHKAHPFYPEIWRSLGDIYLEEKKYPLALHAYDRALEYSPKMQKNNWSLLLARAVAYDRSGNWPKAEQDLKQALLLMPDEPILLNYLGYSWVEKDKNLEQAESMLLRAVENDPDNGAILDSLGWAMLKRNKLYQAVQQLEKAAEKTPQDPAINYHLGVAYWLLGRKQEAINQWNVALVFHPDPSDEKKIRKALKDGYVQSPIPAH
ncbi:tetratricopeptide repeat protein [Entomobacter blattae]|uniref:Beta-barrel assembly-enhancing protease n=1 Tax=Entomobacter blattae TaxID=2762277 RepID=A0A7H1NQ00_9PROT|nr:tetratricopeptide repeat protein [Entomobacter blattae]QNT77860.1 Beta-barrel assembly-enhancing protease [Entomobacter blattae]